MIHLLEGSIHVGTPPAPKAPSPMLVTADTSACWRPGGFIKAMIILEEMGHAEEILMIFYDFTFPESWESPEPGKTTESYWNESIKPH